MEALLFGGGRGGASILLSNKEEWTLAALPLIHGEAEGSENTYSGVLE